MSSFKYYSNGKQIEDTITLSDKDEELLHSVALRLNNLWNREIEDEY